MGLFRIFGLHLLQPIHVHVSSCAPATAGHMTQASRRQHQGRTTIGKGTHHPRATPDLPHHTD